LKREVRFTVFEVISVNQTVATVEEATFKQFYDKQSIFVSAIVHESISKLEASKYTSIYIYFFKKYAICTLGRNTNIVCYFIVILKYLIEEAI